MKKVLSVVLAVAMVLACVASLAFVIGAQDGTVTRTDDALKVDGFYITDRTAMFEGAVPEYRVVTDLMELDNAPYAPNNIITFALELAVYNPYFPGSTVEHTDGAGYRDWGNETTLTIKSDTVNFLPASNTMTLYKPYTPAGNLMFVNMVQVSKQDDLANKGVTLNDDGSLDIDVVYYTRLATTVVDSDDLVSTTDVNNNAQFWTEEGDRPAGLTLYGVSDSTSVEKTSYILVFDGVTTGAADQEGIVTVEREDKPGDTFEDDGVVTVTKNGHTYRIYKFYDDPTASDGNTNDVVGVEDEYGSFAMRWDDRAQEYEDTIYDVDLVGYRVDVLISNKNGELDETANNDDVWGTVGLFETEQVRYTSLWGEELEGKDTGFGISLGFDHYDGTPSVTPKWVGVTEGPLTAQGVQYYRGNSSNEIYRFGTDPDYLWGTDGGVTTYLDNYDLTAREALEQFMSDFGFGTGSNYSYKIQDSDFTDAATFEELGKATYNGNAIVVPQPEEDDDVEEGTGDEEVPDEGDIDEELPDEGDIDEEPIPDEPVPETGDASAAVAVALTAAALVAAAGLAVVLKKAR